MQWQCPSSTPSNISRGGGEGAISNEAWQQQQQQQQESILVSDRSWKQQEESILVSGTSWKREAMLERSGN